MIRNRVSRLLPVALLLLAVAAAPARAAVHPRALILYNAPPGAPPINNELGAARMIGNLLGHFSLSADIEPASRYRRGGSAGYVALFYVQISPSVVPPSALVQEVPHLTLPVCWLGGGLSALPAAAYGLHVRKYEPRSAFNRVRYHGTLLTRGEAALYRFDVTDPRRASVVATVVANNVERPYAVRSGNFWYFGDTAVLGAEEDDRSLAFADLLHDFLGIQHAPARRAFIRIEDVSVASDVKKLRQIADLLSQRHVPFVVSLIPDFIDYSQHKNIPMSSVPEFAAAIRYMAAHGGSIVMHGWTHQLDLGHHHGISADDAEFFNMEGSAGRPQPLPHDPEYYRVLEAHPEVMDALRRRLPLDEVLTIAVKQGVQRNVAQKITQDIAGVEDRLNRGIRTCLASGTPPIGWETPHYVASQIDYLAFSRVFGTGVEQRLVCDDFDYGQTVPYVLKRDLFGTQIFPENLGYVPWEHPEHINDIIAFAGAHAVVRDGMIGHFFHPFIDLKYLAKLVDGVRAAGYTYEDLRLSQHWVQFRDLAIRTGQGKASLRLHDELLHEYYLDPTGRHQHEVWTKQRATGLVTRAVKCPPGWIYVAEGLQHLPAPPMRKPRPRRLSWFGRLLAAVWHPARKPSGPPPRAFPNGAIVWDEKATGAAALDQRSYVNAFAALGTHLEEVAPSQLAARVARPGLNLLVVPEAVAAHLEKPAVEATLGFVRGGGNVIVEGDSSLAEGLGLIFHRQQQLVHGATEMEAGDRAIVWQRPAFVPAMGLPEVRLIYTKGPEHGGPLVAGGPYGRGNFLALALPLDEQSDLGVTRFPYLVYDAFRQFNMRPQFAANGLHAFFDPDHRNAKDLDQLIAGWQAAGITAIHAAAWKATSRNPYDYDRLIEHCHRHGIAVYAWLELPMADADFYNQHPLWREVTAVGAPAFDPDPRKGTWRMLMAMEDPACEAAVLKWTKDLLQKHEWDGVDLAELYFESDMADPDNLLPMHRTAQRRFEAVAGFDPRQLVDPKSPLYWRKRPDAWKKFEDWRVNEVVRLHDDALTAIEQAAREAHRPLDVILTVHDSLGVPTIRRDTGIDTPRLISLLGRHNFSLQIEDPEILWKTDPRRYITIGERYRKLLPPAQADRLMLDINVMPRLTTLGQLLFPTIQQTGTEFDELLASAGKVVRRATIYCEDTVWPDDWVFASEAFAAGAGDARREGSAWQAALRRGAILNLDTGEQNLTLDGRDWPILGDGEILLPPGQHRLAVSQRSGYGWAPPLRVDRATVDLVEAEPVSGGLRVTYDAPGPGSISLDGEAYRIALEDGRELPIDRSASDTMVIVPAGRHTLTINQEEPWHWGVSAASFYCSTGVTIIAGSAIALLTLLYGSVRRRRRRGFGLEEEYD